MPFCESFVRLTISNIQKAKQEMLGRSSRSIEQICWLCRGGVVVYEACEENSNGTLVSIAMPCHANDP
jgi:hypothetical protein